MKSVNYHQTNPQITLDNYFINLSDNHSGRNEFPFADFLKDIWKFGQGYRRSYFYFEKGNDVSAVRVRLLRQHQRICSEILLFFAIILKTITCCDYLWILWYKPEDSSVGRAIVFLLLRISLRDFQPHIEWIYIRSLLNLFIGVLCRLNYRLKFLFETLERIYREILLLFNFGSECFFHFW